MLGSLIAYIREKKGLSKTNISDSTGINVGHLTHIEKGERNPSSKALRDLCKALEIPYQPISYTYDKTLTEDQVRFNLIASVPYNTVPLISNIEDMIICPPSIPDASLAFVMKDDSMKSSIPKGTTVYLEFSTLPAHKEFGLFKYKDSILVRRILYRKNKIVLKADHLLTRDITIESGSELTIIGKIHVKLSEN